MAIYRNVQLSFWTDNKVEDEFTPEDKYFYLYLLTNPQTNICGCYEVSYSQLTNQTGYNKDTVNRLIDRFENVHKVIKFNKDTKEMLILHWHKYNWSKSEKTLKGVEIVANHIKCKEFKQYVFDIVDCIRNDAPYKGHICPIQASVSDTDSDTDTIINNNIDIYKDIISYLNNKCNSNYKYSNKATQRHINGRLSEGYVLEDFQRVIDWKYSEWHGTDMEKYLRPETLFGTKFESYLNNAQRKIEPEQLPFEPTEEEREMTDEEWLKMMQESDL